MSVKIIYRVVTKNDSIGFLKVRVTQNKKAIIKNLRINYIGCCMALLIRFLNSILSSIYIAKFLNSRFMP